MPGFDDDTDPSTPSSHPHARITRRQFLKRASLVAAGALLYSSEIARHELEVIEQPIYLRDLPASFHGMRIAQISDIHYDEYTEPFFLRRVVHRLNQLKPDMVVLTGDYISRDPLGHDFAKAHAPACAAILAGIECPLRHAVLGNHDSDVAPYLVASTLVDHGIPILWNNHVAIERGPHHIWLAGALDPWAGAPDLKTTIPPSAYKDKEPVILLAHEPDWVDSFRRSDITYRADLMLSGHTHGGQVRLPGIGALTLPPLGKNYPNGLYHLQRGEHGMQLYVNKGIGTVTLPLRLFCPPEITLFTLSAEPV